MTAAIPTARRRAGRRLVRPLAMVAVFGVFLLGVALVIGAHAPQRASECAFLLLLKREALRCGGPVRAYEGSGSRLDCAAQRATRVIATRGLEPPERAVELASLFARLDQRVHEGRLTPEAARRQLEQIIGIPDCLSGNG